MLVSSKLTHYIGLQPISIPGWVANYRQSGHQTLVWPASEVVVSHFLALTLSSEPIFPRSKRNLPTGDFINPIMWVSAAEATRRRQEFIRCEAKDTVFSTVKSQQARLL